MGKKKKKNLNQILTQITIICMIMSLSCWNCTMKLTYISIYKHSKFSSFNGFQLLSMVQTLGGEFPL